MESGDQNLTLANLERRNTSHRGREEQGNPLMPMLLSLGQHPALEAAQRRLRDTAKLFAHLDDVVFVCRPDRVAEVEAC